MHNRNWKYDKMLDMRHLILNF